MIQFNTPIQDLGNINSNNLFIKRDDLIPYCFGGNKARKAFLFFDEIDKGGYDYVVTYGSSHSNHCRVIANMAAERNMPCLIIGPEEVSDDTSNSKIMKLLGANIITVPVNEVHDRIESELELLRNKGFTPYFIEGGGHGNLGTEAYVQCYKEIKEYEIKHGIIFDYIFFASGTGTTQAGLVCGKLLNNDDTEIIGISIARKNPRGRNIVFDSVRSYLEGKSISVDVQTSIVFCDEYVGNGYGIEDTEILKAINDSLIRFGIPLDSTYTGKAFTGMKKYLAENNIENKNVLFIHTGGTPLFFDDIERI